ncbi:MAG: ABC transporter ATP-binding protein [Nitrospirota bacterium]
MLSIRNLHTSYGLFEALKGISLEVNKGEIVCLIGSNGAGKSTTLMTISGAIRPKEGDIIFDGARISGIKPDEIVRMGISQVPEGRRIFPHLTVTENLEIGAYSVTARRQKEISSRIKKILDMFPVLGERARQPGGTLSGGEQQMLAIGRALMSGPKMLLLDEPSLGLAPIMVSKVFKIIKEINREGVAILLVEQNAHAALHLSKRGYVIENGRITISGTGDELLGNDQVKKAYLGE